MKFKSRERRLFLRMESHCEANVFLPFWLVTHTRFISRSDKSSLKFLFQTELVVRQTNRPWKRNA